MSRSHRNTTRASRPLIGALAVTIVLGGSVYFHKHKPKSASAGQVPQIAAGVKATDGAAPGKPADPKLTSASSSTSASSTSTGAGSFAQPPQGVLVTQTPLTGSAANPANSADKTSARPVDPSKAVALAITTGVPVIPTVARTAPIQVTASTLVDGKAKKDAGDLLAARDLINAAWLSGTLSESDGDAARELLTEISQKLLFSGKHVDGDAFTEKYQVMSGDRLSRIADRHAVTWELLCKINGLSDPKRVRAGQYLTLINGPFHAVVTKSKFRLDVYLGNPGGPGSTFVMSLPVGLGKDNSTPTGLWVLQPSNKAHPATYYSPRGEGVISADDPRNPLGGYWMGITGVDGEAVGKSSYGIHGTIDPDSIGKQASMGCIRLRHDDIAFLYDALIEGKSKVQITN